MLGLLGRPGGPLTLDELDPRLLVAFLEGIVRESEDGNTALDDLYAPPKPSAPRNRSEEIAAFLALADG